MDVLNTYGGEVISNVGTIVGLVLVIAVCLLLATAAWVGEARMFAAIFVILAAAVVFGPLTTAVTTHDTTPIVHEVTLRPGSVIDAQKYDIIEQRGAIFVIEEREVIE